MSTTRVPTTIAMPSQALIANPPRGTRCIDAWNPTRNAASTLRYAGSVSCPEPGAEGTQAHHIAGHKLEAAVLQLGLFVVGTCVPLVRVAGGTQLFCLKCLWSVPLWPVGATCVPARCPPSSGTEPWHGLLSDTNGTCPAQTQLQ